MKTSAKWLNSGGEKPWMFTCGKLPPDVLQQVQIIIDVELRVMPALHQDLHAADRHQLFDLLADLFRRQHVGIRVILVAHERAERAVDVADVGVIDVAVDDVRDDTVRMLPLPHRVSQCAQLGQSQRTIQPQRLFGRDPLATEHLVLSHFNLWWRKRLSRTSGGPCLRIN